MDKISAVIITLNEKRHIARALESVSWADEILVVDAGSTDGTKEVCQSAGQAWSSKIRLLEREWSGFDDQRNFALEKAENDWILSIDSDERCSGELQNRITEILSDPSGARARAYKVKRVEYFLGKEIRYGIWNPSYQDRFFHREGVRYVNKVHEYPLFPSQPERIHEPIYHWPDFSPEHFLAKMNKYTSIEARDRIEQGQRTNWFRMLFAFPAMFLKNYFYYRAYRDGVHGFAISLLEGVSRVVRHVKMWQIQNRTKS